MPLTSKKSLRLILAITAVVCASVMLRLFNDPEGTNLLVTLVAAFVIYTVSAVIYRFLPVTKEGGLKELLLQVFIQILLAAVLYVLLK